MKNLARFFFAASIVGLATSLIAQPPGGGRKGGPGGGGPGHRGHPIVRVLDTDSNHEISAAELANATASIRSLDTSGDGIVSAEELHARPANAPERPADAPARPERPAGDNVGERPVDPIMLALDANGDGALSVAETANASASLAALDANKDGKLTPDEFRPLPPTK